MTKTSITFSVLALPALSACARTGVSGDNVNPSISPERSGAMMKTESSSAVQGMMRVESSSSIQGMMNIESSGPLETMMKLSPSQLVQQLASAPIPTTDAQWQKRLTFAQYNILRQQGTETPFSSLLDQETRAGIYYGADCGEPLFRSEQKYDSGTGWPSFWAPINSGAVILKSDTSLGMYRTEVVSAKCGSHLGHVFDDGPQPTGKRYCMNGTALIFVPDSSKP